MKHFKRVVILSLIPLLFYDYSVRAQCCSGGSANPIGGGSSLGVLQEHQAEVSISYHYDYSDKIMTENKTAKPDTGGNYMYINSEGTPVYISFLGFKSHYLYSRFAYGMTSNFTLSVEMGYSLNKTEYQKTDTIGAKGIGDLILFPRFNVFRKSTDKAVSELTLGVGIKIPIGTYRDSSTYYLPNGNPFYIRKPLGVQPATGSNDFIFYGFFIRSYPEKKFRLFTSALYIAKGWNPEGEKLGDYASLGLFAGKTFSRNWGATLQLRGEYIGRAKLNPFVSSSIQPEVTGSRKLFFVPQISYTCKRNLTLYAFSEFPLYQYVNAMQVASKTFVTSGFTYRFFPKKPSALIK